MSIPNKNSLPFADAATIVRANQKDNYFNSTLSLRVQNVLRILKGQRFINSHPEEIAMTGKTLYYLLTTVLGARTLGEEYVDILYVSRLGKRFPNLFSRLSFTASFIILPYFVTRLVRKIKSTTEESSSWPPRILSSYPSLLDTIMNIHIALFYFEGLFYSLSKRVFGLRYALGHNKDQKKLQANSNYSVLGIIILIQFVIKLLININKYSNDKKRDENEEFSPGQVGQVHPNFYKLEQLEKLNTHINENSALAKKFTIDLSDEKELPYIPKNSRNCMLCLSPMIDPSAANCGHFFCWSCIVDWIRERPECPLCRQTCMEQNLLPLR